MTWILAHYKDILAAVTVLMTVLAAIGNLAPGTKVGAWCLAASTDIRKALGAAPPLPPAPPPPAPPAGSP